MISHIFILLVILGASTVFFTRDRAPRFVAFLLLAAATFLLIFFAENWRLVTSIIYLHPLLEYKKLHFNLNLSSLTKNYALIFPFFALTCLSLLNNAFVSQETQRIRLAGLMLLNLAFLILLVCATDLVMLIVSSSLIGVLALYVINDFEAKKTFIFYNLAADMGIFTAFAIIYGQLQQVDLAALQLYSEQGAHLPLVSGLLLVSIFIKTGMFLFQNQTFSYRDLSFNRLIFLSFCSAPVTGIIIFSKSQILINAWPYAIYLMAGFAVSSIIYALSGALIYDNIKEKALSINMLMWSFLYVLLFSGTGLGLAGYAWVLLWFYLFNQWLGLITSASSDEIYFSRMGGFAKPLWPLLLMGILLPAVLMQNLFVGLINHPHLGWYYATIFFSMLIIISYLLRQMFFGCPNCDEKVWAFLHIPNPLRWLPGVAILLYLGYASNFYALPLWGGLAVLALLVWVYPLRRMSKLYASEELQFSEFFNRFYELLILAPLSVLGRILWLAVDFLIIERTIINSLSHFTGVLIGLSQQIHSARLITYLIMSAFGLGIMFILLKVGL